MTTIIWDGRYLAADTRASLTPSKGTECGSCGSPDHRVRKNAQKIVFPATGKSPTWEGHKILAVAMAGSTQFGTHIRSYILEHGDKILKTVNEMNDAFGGLKQLNIHNSFLIITEKYQYIVSGEANTLSSTRHPLNIPMGVGSGYQVAQSYVKNFGVNAYQAIQLTALTEPNTGAPVFVFDKQKYDAGEPYTFKKPGITRDECKAIILQKLGGRKPRYKHVTNKTPVFVG